MAVHMERNGETEVTFVGRVLAKRERNWHDDSDFYAVVWDDEAGRTREVEYATTRGWTYNNGAKVDADDETLEKYRAYLVERETARLVGDAMARLTEVKRGATVRLTRAVRTRKNGAFDKGDEGTVFWHGVDKFARNGYRAGVEFADGRRHFFAEHDLEGVATDTVDEAGCREYAKVLAKDTVESVRRMREYGRGGW